MDAESDQSQNKLARNNQKIPYKFIKKSFLEKNTQLNLKFLMMDLNIYFKFAFSHSILYRDIDFQSLLVV